MGINARRVRVDFRRATFARAAATAGLGRVTRRTAVPAAFAEAGLTLARGFVAGVLPPVSLFAARSAARNCLRV